MGVFANGLEVSGKAVNARTIAAFPDTCFTPPENPATPPGTPVPYPSFGFASNTEKGTATVFIGGKTVNIKNKSNLSKTSGTEAGRATKKGVISSQNTGKGYFNSWSNDVKFDGEPVIRMSDLATNNHTSPATNSPSWPHMAAVAIPLGYTGPFCPCCEGPAHPHQRDPHNPDTLLPIIDEEWYYRSRAAAAPTNLAGRAEDDLATLSGCSQRRRLP